MRSVAIIPKIKDEVIKLLTTTTLNCTEIGKLVSCSRGPVSAICCKFNIQRPPQKGRKRDKIKCKTCGKYINHIISNIKSELKQKHTKFCSKECYTLWQKSPDNKGSNNPGWKGGVETEINKLRKTSEWKDWRTKIFERDKYTCYKCEKVGGLLHPHHIIPKSIDLSLIYDINNGITLCKSCHMEVHHKRDMNYMKLVPKVSNQYLMKNNNKLVCMHQ
jgi:hypothetical protein